MTLTVWTTPLGLVELPDRKLLIVLATLPRHPLGPDRLEPCKEAQKGVAHLCQSIMNHKGSSVFVWLLAAVQATELCCLISYQSLNAASTTFDLDQDVFSCLVQLCLALDITITVVWGYTFHRPWDCDQCSSINKAKAIILWHHVNYLCLPKGVYTGNDNLRSDLPKRRWNLELQLRCQ